MVLLSKTDGIIVIKQALVGVGQGVRACRMLFPKLTLHEGNTQPRPFAIDTDQYYSRAFRAAYTCLPRTSFPFNRDSISQRDGAGVNRPFETNLLPLAYARFHRYKTIKPGEASINPDNLPQLANDYGQRYTASTTYSSNIRLDEIYSFDSSPISSSKELSNPLGNSNWKNLKENERYGESIRYI